jgi:hypothetical protein
MTQNKTTLTQNLNRTRSNPLHYFTACLLLISSASAWAIGPQVQGSTKIIGENTTIAVEPNLSNLDVMLRPYISAIGLISMNGGVCSGTHIGNGYVLTAGHCYIDKVTETPLKQTSCAGTKVYWGYRGSTPATAIVSGTSRCIQLLYAERSSKRDFAIFKVDIAPKATIPVSLSGSRPDSGTKITILGHPQGRPLAWSQYCKIQSSLGSRDLFSHQCDTEPGNSGSAVLALNSRGIPMVIGIHAAAAAEGYEYNIATYFSDAMRVLKSQGLTVTALLGSQLQ